MCTDRYAAEDLTAFVTDVLVALGNPRQQAEINAEVIVWSDLVGRHNHGIVRLPALIKRVRKGNLDLASTPVTETLSPTSECVDAKHGMGQYAGHFATRRAIALAEAEGVGVVGVRNSNHYGVCAYYLNQMAQAGMIGIALSNSTPKVAVHMGRDPVHGTNPFSFGVPMPDGRTLMLDMATAGLAGSTVKEHAEKGWPLPEGFLIDQTGAPVTDPSEAGKATLLPAAGAKGFGLGLLVEVLCGVLTGGAISHQVLSMYNDFSGPARVGHFFLAIDIRRWMALDAFFERMQFLTGIITSSGEAVRLPGEDRWKAAEENRQHGIPISRGVKRTLETLALELNLLPPRKLTVPAP